MNTASLLAEAEIKNYHYSPANMKRARLEEFPQIAYEYLGRAKDATFELTDAIFSRPKSFPEALPVLDFRLGMPGAEISL